MSAYTPAVQGRGVKASVQRIGGFLASMVMPNIAAFLAWGLLTALFIPTGWLPNETAAQLVDPMIKYLLPLLIGFTGGRLVHGQRGGVVGAVATMGVVVGADVPMFLGAMIAGPAAAWVIKKVDSVVQDRTRSGFEMLVDNFTAAIVGGAAALGGLWGVGPVVERFADAAGDLVGWLVDHSLLPLAAIVVEPAKVLFLNNAINHGVFGPLGAGEAAESGKSILFMLETNPGPGLGVLLAYLFFGPRALRPSVPAAIAVQFLGGIHEIYFPYILMKPKMVLAAIAGGAAGILVFLATDAGLVATPAPGSIFAYGAVTPRGEWLGVFGGVFIAAAVSFVVGSALLGFGRGEKAEPAGATDAEADLASASAAVKDSKPSRPQLPDDVPAARPAPDPRPADRQARTQAEV